MARETKVGLVVAASFLCLVGVVVAARLHQGDESKENPPATTKVSVGKEAQPDVKPSGPVKPGEQAQAQKPNADPSSPSLPQAPPGFGLRTPPALDPSKTAVFDPSKPPAVDPSKTAIFDPSKPPAVDPSKPAIFDPSKPPAVDPSKPAIFDPSKPPAVDPSKTAVFDPSKPPAVDPSKTAIFDPSKPPAVDPSKTAIFDPSKPPAVDPSKTAIFDPSKPPAVDPSKPALFDPSKPPAVDPSKPALFDPSKPPAVDPSKPALFDPSKPPAVDPSKTALFDPSKPPAVIPAIVDPAKLTPAKPNTSGLPAVKDYLVKAYRCEPGTTTFPQVSMKLYGNEKYARALYQFNRDNNIRVDPLQAGQEILFPPADVLDTKYSNLIGAATTPASAIPSAPAATTGSGVTIRPATPLNSGIGNPNNLNSAPPGTAIAAVSNGPYKSYKVRDGGEHIVLIAENTLGDRNRWGEIYRLNATIDPRNPLPAGAVIQLPANARVP